MELEKLSFEIYEKYRDTIDRYMDLIQCEHREKIDTATVHIMYAIQDINYQIEQYVQVKPELSVYYQTMLKTDFLIGMVEELYVFFFNNNIRKKVWGSDYKEIRQFRLFRSLTLAHPLSTTYYDDLGFGKENVKWCQDVRPRSKICGMFSEEMRHADYIIEVKESGKDFTEKIPITLKENIVSVTLIGLKHLEAFTSEIEKKLSFEIERLKNTSIQATHGMNITDYTNALLAEVEMRYPNEIEKIVYADNTEVKHCILLKALERLNYTFGEPMREERYKAYKAEIQQAVYAYGESIQHMDLEYTNAHEQLSNILYPDTKVLSDKSMDEQIHYKYEKITMYLSDSDERSVESAREKLERFSYEGCRNCNVCTNAEWGVIQLMTLKDEFNPYFSIDFDATNKELFFQFCIALYYANRVLA